MPLSPLQTASPLDRLSRRRLSCRTELQKMLGRLRLQGRRSGMAKEPLSVRHWHCGPQLQRATRPPASARWVRCYPSCDRHCCRPCRAAYTVVISTSTSSGSSFAASVLCSPAPSHRGPGHRHGGFLLLCRRAPCRLSSACRRCHILGCCFRPSCLCCRRIYPCCPAPRAEMSLGYRGRTKTWRTSTSAGVDLMRVRC